ncbi:MAG: M48 family metalloprotease [Halofilum sp. (in: g-proteobacteria)]|nr:M48 family metalloprotease [Halofilum sp. (in: g-proteobacteria)]
MRRLPCLLLLLGLCVPAGADEDLEFVKKTAERLESIDLSPAAERQVGLGMAERVLGATPPVEDEEVQRYVNRVGRWVAEQSSRPDLDWTFAVVDSPAVNAYAAPGGHVFITLGLFLLLESEAELAVILGHEIAHVTERDHLEALKTQLALGVVQDLLQSEGVEGIDDATLDQLVLAGVSLYAIGLAREDELNADRIGIVLAARAGYDPWALLITLTLLEALNPAAPAMSLHSSTHPPPQVRRALVQNQLDNQFDLDDPGVQGRARFAQMRDRLSAARE